MDFERRGHGRKLWQRLKMKIRTRWKALHEIYQIYICVFGEKDILFFRRDALKEQFGKDQHTVRCLAVKSILLGTRHPRITVFITRHQNRQKVCQLLPNFDKFVKILLEFVDF